MVLIVSSILMWLGKKINLLSVKYCLNQFFALVIIGFIVAIKSHTKKVLTAYFN